MKLRSMLLDNIDAQSGSSGSLETDHDKLVASEKLTSSSASDPGKESTSSRQTKSAAIATSPEGRLVLCRMCEVKVREHELGSHLKLCAAALGLRQAQQASNRELEDLIQSMTRVGRRWLLEAIARTLIEFQVRHHSASYLCLALGRSSSCCTIFLFIHAGLVARLLITPIHAGRSRATGVIAGARRKRVGGNRVVRRCDD